MKRHPFIETFCGVRFKPLAPVAADILIRDIAHATANQCRFSGHTRFHYSVAQHSVLVSELVEAWGLPPIVWLWALLHDGAEAFLVDLPTPVKSQRRIGYGYRQAERRLMRALCRRFGLPRREPKAVRQADAVLLVTEARDLMFHRPAHWSKLREKPLATRIRPWAPAVAEYEFLRRFEQVTAAVKVELSRAAA